jgi:hypothetical protein
MRENIVDMVMEMEFGINKYSEVFYNVGPVYRRLAKFIVIDKYIGFPREGYNFSFTDVEFHTVSNAPTNNNNNNNNNNNITILGYVTTNCGFWIR